MSIVELTEALVVSPPAIASVYRFSKPRLGARMRPNNVLCRILPVLCGR